MPMRYREVIRMPLWLLALIYFFLLSLVLSIWAALGDAAAILSFLATTTLLALIAIKSALVIQVDEKELRIGSAHIELKFLGEVQTLTNVEMSRLRTRDADPAAFLAIRFWSPTGVRVAINDPRDLTPYWLITSKNGEALALALALN
jgi:Protein of unknown function (DUF3093)